MPPSSHPVLPTIALALVACTSTPAEPSRLEPPRFETRVEQFRGGILEGSSVATAEDEPLDVADLWDVDAELVFVEYLPESLEPLATQSRLIVGTRGGEPLLSASLLTAGARVGTVDPRRILDAPVDGRPNRSLPMGALDALLPKGTTAVFTGGSPEPRILDDGMVVQRTIGVLVSRGTTPLDGASDAPTVSLLVEDVAPEGLARGPDTGAEPDRIVQRQLVILETRPQVDGEPLVLLFRSPFERGGDDSGDDSGADGGGGLLVAVRVTRVDAVDDEIERRLAICRTRLAESVEAALARATGVPASETDVRALQSGIDALAMAAHHRPALVFLAGSARAPLALDFALSADDPTLAGWVASIREDLGDVVNGAELDAAERERISWGLERAAWLLAVDLLDRERLPRELEGVLLRHAGEAGRFASTIRGAVDRATDVTSLQDNLVRENRALLESSDPAARVRAYDWLAGREAAPAGYDPFADRAARRDALRADRDRAAQPLPEDATGRSEPTAEANEGNPPR